MNYALLSVSTELVHGLPELRRCLKAMESFQFQALSSVYKRIEDRTEGTLSAEVLLAVSVATEMSLPEFREVIEGLSLKAQGSRLLLLAFNHEVDLDPRVPIPNPELHLDPLILHCAAEIQGGFEHPVLGRSLQELVKSSQSAFGRVQFEFISRGEALLSPTSEVP